MRPVRLRHLLPFAEGVQPELQQPLRLFLPGRYLPDDVLVEPFGQEFLLNVRHEALLVFGGSDLLYDVLVRHRLLTAFSISSSLPAGITGDRKDSIWRVFASASGMPRERM